MPRATAPGTSVLVRAEGVTVLVATHDRALIDLADTVLSLVDGRIAPEA
jgi:ABC-type lipoprotein export system ATPase subunit